MISEFSLFLFTLLGGTAAGAYAFTWAFPTGESKRRWLLPGIALVLLAIGGVALLLHLGHPERMLFAFSNLSAGITREGITTGLFGALVLVDLIFAIRSNKPVPKALGIVTALAGVALLVAMGSAYTQFHGVTAWANWTSMALFVIGGLSAGVCLISLCNAGIARNGSFGICAVALNVLFACTAIALGAHFATIGYSLIPFICSAALAIAAAISSWLAKGRDGFACIALSFALALAAVIIARYAFYLVV
ncbi:MAG: dimethyl sulfoxide reductase anchor subunit [Eggerthellaceae bacterium]|nr:dimethyl sulfoxide reductase anchor subunit [Eggerthellaceae bacterium]